MFIGWSSPFATFILISHCTQSERADMDPFSIFYDGLLLACKASQEPQLTHERIKHATQRL